MGDDTAVPALTKEQAAILGAFTGILCGPFSDLHRYAEVKLGRAVWTHEFGSEAVSKQLREASREDFMSIVARDAK